jgi:hypothetical protein
VASFPWGSFVSNEAQVEPGSFVSNEAQVEPGSFVSNETQVELGSFVSNESRRLGRHLRGPRREGHPNGTRGRPVESVAIKVRKSLG